jgi:hypothetical protein
MASIALSGTGTDKKVVLKTIDGVQKVSCSCCDPCASLPDEITIVFSGITPCIPRDGIPPYPAILSTATLSRMTVEDPFEYNDGISVISVVCVPASQYVDTPEELPAGVDPDSNTPLFLVQYIGSGSGGGEDGYGLAFLNELPGEKNEITSQIVDCGELGREGWGYGGTATISWETTP